MFKLIFTLLTMTSAPGAPPTTTSSTTSVDFRDGVVCGAVLAAARRQGERVVPMRGATVTVRFAGGHCVQDGPLVAGAPPVGALLDPLGLLR